MKTFKLFKEIESITYNITYHIDSLPCKTDIFFFFSFFCDSHLLHIHAPVRSHGPGHPSQRLPYRSPKGKGDFKNHFKNHFENHFEKFTLKVHFEVFNSKKRGLASRLCLLIVLHHLLLFLLTHLSRHLLNQHILAPTSPGNLSKAPKRIKKHSKGSTKGSVIASARQIEAKKLFVQLRP